MIAVRVFRFRCGVWSSVCVRSSSVITLGLHRGLDQKIKSSRPRHRSANQDEIALRVDTHDLEILLDPPDVSHVPAHLFPLKNPAGILVLTDGTGLTVRLGVTMSCSATTETMTTHDACESTANRRAAHVYLLPLLEYLHG